MNVSDPAPWGWFYLFYCVNRRDEAYTHRYNAHLDGGAMSIQINNIPKKVRFCLFIWITSQVFVLRSVVVVGASQSLLRRKTKTVPDGAGWKI